MAKLTLSAVKKLDKTPGRHKDGDSNLFLWVRNPSARYWTYRFRLDGRQTELSLGAYPETSLDEARAAYAEKSAQVLKGVDPIADKRARRQAARAIAASIPSFGQIVDRYIDSHAHSWKNAKHAQQWRNTTKAGSYCDPIRALPVDKVTTAMIHDLLEPLWQRAPETAQRLRGRIEMALDFAQARGHIGEDKRNPARWKGRLDKLLPKRPEHVNHVALPYAKVPHLMQRLRQRGDKGEIAARALEFTVLTAARSGETFAASWNEFDLSEKIWTIPASKMKAGKLHRVPLSKRVIELVRRQFETAPKGDDGRPLSPYVFPGRRPGRPLSNMAMTVLLRRMRVTAKVDVETAIVTAHGFRSAFHAWATEAAKADLATIEKCLAHKVGNKSSQAYDRSDRYDLRIPLMTRWARYCDDAPEGQVIPIAAARSL